MENSVKTNRQIIWEHAKPSWFSYGVVALLLLLTIAFACSLLTQAAPADVVGIFCIGPMVFLPLLALLKRQPPAGRVFMLSMAALAVGFTGLVSAIGIAQLPREDGASGLGFFFFIPVPFALILLIPTGFFLSQAVKRARHALRENWLRRTAVFLQEKGETTFSELAWELKIAPSAVDNLVDELRQRDKAGLTMYVPYQRIYTRRALLQHYQELSTLVTARGQLYLDDLALEMDAPQPLITQWIYNLVQGNRFSGYINWDTGIIYAAHAAQIREAGQCPNCQGKLGLDGARVRCTFCNTEILLGEASHV